MEKISDHYIQKGAAALAGLYIPLTLHRSGPDEPHPERVSFSDGRSASPRVPRRVQAPRGGAFRPGPWRSSACRPFCYSWVPTRGWWFSRRPHSLRTC